MSDKEDPSGPSITPEKTGEPKLESLSPGTAGTESGTSSQDPSLRLEYPKNPEPTQSSPQVEDTHSVMERMASSSAQEGTPEGVAESSSAQQNDGSTGFINAASSARESSGLTSRRKMEFLNVAEWISTKVQSRGYAFYGKLGTVVLSVYFLADVVANIAGRYIPEPPIARMLNNGNQNRVKSISEYEPIFSRNLFNHDGLIPGDENGNGPSDPGGAPVKTTLPLNLIGTMILEDQTYSLATIEDKSASLIYPVRVDEEIPKKAKIIKIEARKVIFLNITASRREYVELPEDPTGATPTVTLAVGKGAAIEKVGANQYNIPKAELDKTLADFNNVLTQARAVPYFEKGVPAGYRFFQIAPGSVYEKLGLQNGDVVAGINGTPLTDPAKAFEFLNSLKEGASHMELQINTNGVTKTNTYDFH